MKAIYKQRILIIDGPQRITGPGTPRVVRFGLQDGEPTVWFEVEPGVETGSALVRIVGTGHPYYASCRYVGSIDQEGYVWHLLAE